MKRALAFVLGGILVLSLAACGGTAAAERGGAMPDSTAAPVETAAPKATATPEPTAAPEPTATPEPTDVPADAPADEMPGGDGNAEAGSGADGSDAAADVPGVSPDFKEVMDSYEAFFDEYAAFMERYQNSGSSTGMMMDYLSFLTRYAETMQKLDEIDTDSLSGADMAYYTQVMLRISAKLTGATG